MHLWTDLTWAEEESELELSVSEQTLVWCMLSQEFLGDDLIQIGAFYSLWLVYGQVYTLIWGLRDKKTQ